MSESRVARLVAEGLSDEQVAERLGIGVMDVSAELVIRGRGERVGHATTGRQGETWSGHSSTAARHTKG